MYEEYIIIRISKEETNDSYDIFFDYEDFDDVSKGQWFVSIQRKNTHLKNIPNILWTKIENEKQINYQLHQYILNTKYTDVIIDHINMNRFDNRRNNLRITNSKVNAINQVRNGYRYEKETNTFLARIRVNGKLINIGRYKTELEAETIYLKCAIILGNDKISTDIQQRIKKLNISLSEIDYENKYIKKVILLKEGKEVPQEYNGKFTAKFIIIKNMELINQLVSDGYSFNKVSKYLYDNGITDKRIKGETIKKYHVEYTHNMR